MSSAMLRKSAKLFLPLKSSILTSAFARSSSSGKRVGGRLGQTSVFVQSGLKISELPLVVQKVQNVLRENTPSETFGRCEQKDRLNEEEAEESREIVEGLKRCFSVGGLFRLLETIPVEEVTPSVAVEALKLIINFNLQSGNFVVSYRQMISDTNQSPDKVQASTDALSRCETFQQSAFVNLLLEIIYRSRNPEAIIEGLEIVANEDGLTQPFKDKLYEETMVLATEGVFTLQQICKVISVMRKFHEEESQCQESADKMWAALLDKVEKDEHSLSSSSLMSIFGTIPHLKSSRAIIMKFLGNKVGDFWQSYKVEDIMVMLRVLTEINEGPCGSIGVDGLKIMPVISQWFSKNLHSLGEDELLAMVFCFQKLDFVDEPFIQSLERYVKARGCQIKEADLVAAICNYCLSFRIRSKTILEGAAAYFTMFGTTLSAAQFHSIVRIFGELNVHPNAGFKFWDVLEHMLEHKFVEFSPKDVIDLLLSFVYIERYPLNFVQKLFNSHFMDRLHSQEEKEVLRSRLQLKLFDTVMKLESLHYDGPYLPKNTSYRQIHTDYRVLRLCNQLISPLADVIGDVKRLGKSVVLSSLPLHPLFVVDMMVYPSVAASALRFGYGSTNGAIITLIIHTPEHYDRSGKHLLGPIAMKVRLLKKMGFRVLELDYETVDNLRSKPVRLRSHLRSELSKIEKPSKRW